MVNLPKYLAFIPEYDACAKIGRHTHTDTHTRTHTHTPKA